VYNQTELFLKERGGECVQDSEIIAWLRAHDERGVEALITHYGALMRYVISPVLPSLQDREECLSEAAMRVWGKIELYDAARGSWRSWLTALCRNAAINYARNRNPAGEAEELVERQPSPEPTPEEAVVRQERNEAIKRALGRLSDKDRMLFYRKYYYLQSTAQIASELAMTERAVEGRLYRLKRELRRMLGGEGHE